MTWHLEISPNTLSPNFKSQNCNSLISKSPISNVHFAKRLSVKGPGKSMLTEVGL